MKKFRGKKRYFRNIWRRVNSFRLELDSDSWFDFYHIHLDWEGVGNESVKIRREHIKAYFALYKKVLDELKMFDKPYQCWLFLDDDDAGQDAVFVHSPNPNKDNFPLKIEKLNWESNIPTTFSDLINQKQFEVGQLNIGYGDGFYIQSKGQEIKL